MAEARPIDMFRAGMANTPWISWVVWCAAALSLGCSGLVPRFPADVQTAVTRSDMQRLETEKLILYYPEGTKERALHIAGRLEYCRRQLEQRTVVKNDLTQEKSVFVLPVLPFNNAYVQPTFAQRQIAVIPQYNTAIDLFEQFNIPPDPGTIGCHEMVHDMHSRQVRGAARVIRHVLGHYYSPQMGLDSWFWEGLAVWYETRLTGLGRLHDAYFDGHFHAGFAGKTINGGDFSTNQRNTPFGAQYLVGSHFVDYLVHEYGEKRLWLLINEQANDVAFPIGINWAFNKIYDKSLSELIDDFSRDVQEHYPVRARSPEQRTLRSLPSVAQFYRGKSGHTVLATQGPDDYARYAVYDPNGNELLSHRLNDLGVGRRIAASSVGMISGLSLTADGKHLYFVIVDTGPVYSESHLMHLDVERDELEVVEQNLEGAGGSVSPDGKHYFYSHAEGPSLALQAYDLTSKRVTRLTPHVTGRYPSNPVISPDGTRLLVTEATDDGIRLALFDAGTGQRLGDVSTPPGITLQASWIDDQRVIYSGSDGRHMQAFETNVVENAYRKLTNAPYVVGRPFSDGKTVKFLNRDGWHWTLDEAPYTPPPTVAALEVPAAPTEVVSTSYSHHQTPKDVPVKVLSDQSYSAFDQFFVPEKWGPWFVSRQGNGTALGAFVTGKDRLGYQAWSLSAAYDTKAKLPTVGVSYLNNFGAPWVISGDFSFIGRREGQTEDLVPRPDEAVRIRETIADVMLSRAWYDSTSFGLGGRYIDTDYQLERSRLSIVQERFTGPLASFGYSTFDGTAYAGPKLGVSLDGMGTYFPKRLSTASFDMTDALGQLRIELPLPLSKRHKLTLQGVGRGLLGSPRDVALLQVGGAGNESPLENVGRDQRPESRLAAGVLPVGLRFYQPLRGFEDLALFGRYVATGQASYTYPFIFDVGSATAINFLPAAFLRQIDFELFAAGASLIDSGRQEAVSVGAALTFKVNLWLLPLAFKFQEARRLTYDEQFAFYFALGPE